MTTLEQTPNTQGLNPDQPSGGDGAVTTNQDPGKKRWSRGKKVGVWVAGILFTVATVFGGSKALLDKDAGSSEDADSGAGGRITNGEGGVLPDVDPQSPVALLQELGIGDAETCASQLDRFYREYSGKPNAAGVVTEDPIAPDAAMSLSNQTTDPTKPTVSVYYSDRTTYNSGVVLDGPDRNVDSMVGSDKCLLGANPVDAADVRVIADDNVSGATEAGDTPSIGETYPNQGNQYDMTDIEWTNIQKKLTDEDVQAIIDAGLALQGSDLRTDSNEFARFQQNVDVIWGQNGNIITYTFIFDNQSVFTASLDLTQLDQ